MRGMAACRDGVHEVHRSPASFPAHSLYRNAFVICGYVFGTGTKSLCTAGSTRGNEYQQLYVCSKLVGPDDLQSLRADEERFRSYLRGGVEVLHEGLIGASRDINIQYWCLYRAAPARLGPSFDCR